MKPACNYRETSMFRHHPFPRNMTELRAATPPPPSNAGTEDIYIYIYIHLIHAVIFIVILVGLHVLVVRAKYKINVIKI